MTAGDVEQDPHRALDRLLQQRRGDSDLGRLGGAVLAAGRSDTHQGAAGVAHDRADVSEVEVDEPGNSDQVGDPLDALAQHVVRLAERVDHRRAPLDDRQELLVGDHDQRVDDLPQSVDSLTRLAPALCALELERTRDDADGQRADLVLRNLRDHRRRARAGAAALARGHEHHVRALQRLLDVIARLGRRREANVRVCTRAEPLR